MYFLLFKTCLPTVELYWEVTKSHCTQPQMWVRFDAFSAIVRPVVYLRTISFLVHSAAVCVTHCLVMKSCVSVDMKSFFCNFLADIILAEMVLSS